MMDEADYAVIQDDMRRSFTASLAGQIAAMMEDATTISGLSPGLPVSEALLELRAAWLWRSSPSRRRSPKTRPTSRKVDRTSPAGRGQVARELPLTYLF